MSGTRNALAVAFSRHFMAVLPLRMHQIFMLAFAGLRVEGEEAQVLVVSQPPPLAFLMFLLSDCWEACATSVLIFLQIGLPIAYLLTVCHCFTRFFQLLHWTELRNHLTTL